jgi:ribosomal protein S12 methylthiotransferase accessory factor
MPAVAAISARADGSAVVFGFGAHFRIETAARHALLELQQVLGAIDDMLDGGVIEPSTLLGQWLNSINLNDQAWLRPGLTKSPVIGTPGVPLDASLKSCLDIARRHHMEFLVANLTRPDVEVPVARVIVPGLRSAQPRFGPGHLYDVPLALGWLDRRRPESELNPFPFFL